MKNRRNRRLRPIFYLLLGCFLSVCLSLLAGEPLVRPFTVPAPSNALSDGSELTQVSPAQIYAVRPDILAVEVAPPAVTLGQQIPYVVKAGDRIIVRRRQSRISRNGVPIGILVGINQDTLYTYDTVADSSFRVALADASEHYRIASRRDRHYRKALSPVAIARKTKPASLSRRSDGVRQWPSAHTLYLVLPHPMAPGKQYQLSFPELGLADTEFVYAPMSARSEAVHVSQLGFRPADPFKVGYLSTWMGNGGGVDYPDGLKFSLVDSHSDQPVYSGVAVRRRASAQKEGPRNRDYTLSAVHQLNFSSFRKPGKYRLCVEGVGCSFDFEIGLEVWDRAFFTAARGFLHQRSGSAVGAPHTKFTRPRAFHPADGTTVYQSTLPLLDASMGLGEKDTFAALQSGKTEAPVPDAWGGYFDAADWDRRIQLLAVPRSLLELYNLFPNHFRGIDLNLPESTNTLPDILDEALWSLDFFRRLQTPEGGIRGGIESAAHPIKGEASWQDSLVVLAYAPDVWSSYFYAGVAARAALTLRAYDAQLADTYQVSALAAMAYAERNYEGDRYTEGNKLHDVIDQRNLSALELYRLTQDPAWHDLFLQTTVFQSDAVDAYVHGKHDQRTAAFLYARLSVKAPESEGAKSEDAEVKSEVEPTGVIEDNQEESQPEDASERIDSEKTRLKFVTVPAVDESIQRNARKSFLRRADELVQLTKTTGFGWSRQRPTAPLGWRNGTGAPTATDILRAHALTGRTSYLKAGLSGTQFSAGANPANMVFTTGLGDRSPQNPLISDYRITGQAPPPGITVFGPTDFAFYSDYWTLDVLAKSTFPPPRRWPTAENYFDVYSHPIGAEFTVHYMVASAYTWGYLAARED